MDKSWINQRLAECQQWQLSDGLCQQWQQLLVDYEQDRMTIVVVGEFNNG